MRFFQSDDPPRPHSLRWELISGCSVVSADFAGRVVSNQKKKKIKTKQTNQNVSTYLRCTQAEGMSRTRAEWSKSSPSVFLAQVRSLSTSPDEDFPLDPALRPCHGLGLFREEQAAYEKIWIGKPTSAEQHCSSHRMGQKALLSVCLIGLLGSIAPASRHPSLPCPYHYWASLV